MAVTTKGTNQIQSSNEYQRPSPEKAKRALSLFYISVICTGIGLAMSDSVFGNYFKEAYGVSAQVRGFIEFPRELPGFLCVIAVTLLAGLGEVRLAILAQLLSAAGLMILGLFTPMFGVMLVFLFINSLGMHTYMPLQDSIGLGLVGEEGAGGKMGFINGIRTAAGFVGAVIIFFGFRFGWFSFTAPVKYVFVIASLFFVAVLFLLLRVRKYIGDPPIKTAKNRLLLRKEYSCYYILACVAGAQKQIMYVFGPWVLIEILGKQADTMAILMIIGSFIGIFFIPFIGRCVDRFGLRKMLYADAISFIAVYILYGILSGGFSTGMIATVGVPVFFAFALYITDRMSMSMSMVRVVYLRSIALDPSEITPTLSTGISMDHVISITSAYLGGMVWAAWGPQYVFYFAALLSVINLVVARIAPMKKG